MQDNNRSKPGCAHRIDRLGRNSGKKGSNLVGEKPLCGRTAKIGRLLKK